MEAKEDVLPGEGSGQQFLGMTCAVDHKNSSISGSCLPLLHLLPFPKTYPLCSNTNLA